MILPENVKYIINRLNSAGHRADVVGGPVRDWLRGVQPHDFDITTSATPDEVKLVFSGKRTVDTGIKHGTVTLVIDGENYEITTYRVDGEYTDSRHPDTVSFTPDIKEDLARRDFTVNSMAYNPQDGLTDPFGGRSDLAAKIIRAVGDPVLRFSEDALRIMRGMRFAATLEFEVEESTRRAMLACAGLLPKISVERIFSELWRLIGGHSAYQVLFDFSDVIRMIVPELSLKKLPPRELFDTADSLTRLSSLFLFGAEASAPEIYERAMRRLHTDTATAKNGRLMLEYYDRFDLCAEAGLLRLLTAVGPELAHGAITLAEMKGVAVAASHDLLERVICSGRPYLIRDLAVDGDLLRSLGYSGRDIGDRLRALLEAVMDGSVDNSKEALIQYLRTVDITNG